MLNSFYFKKQETINDLFNEYSTSNLMSQRSLTLCSEGKNYPVLPLHDIVFRLICNESNFLNAKCQMIVEMLD